MRKKSGSGFESSAANQYDLRHKKHALGNDPRASRFDA
jgi:hypothetical protein